MIDNRRFEDTLRVNFPVFEGDEPDINVEEFDDLDFEDERRSVREDGEIDA